MSIATYPEIRGHLKERQALRASAAAGQLPHALCFIGPSGVGKRLVAWEVIQTLFCMADKDKPCGECDDCLKVAKRMHPDVIEIMPEGKSHSIRIESIRQMKARVHLKPAQAKAQVVICDDAHTMNAESQNALLKVLEEPPNHVHLFLITDQIGNLFATIRSRCQKKIFAQLDTAEVAAVLNAQPAMDQAVTAQLAEVAGGSVGRALAMNADEIKDCLEVVFGLLQVAKTPDVLRLPDWKSDKHTDLLMFDLLSKALRDLYLIKVMDAPSDELFFPSHQKTLAAVAPRFSLIEIESLMENIGQARERIEMSSNSKLVFNQMLFDMQVRII